MTSESASHIILIPTQPVGSENNDNVINALLPSFSALRAQQFSLPVWKKYVWRTDSAYKTDKDVLIMITTTTTTIIIQDYLFFIPCSFLLNQNRKKMKTREIKLIFLSLTKNL